MCTSRMWLMFAFLSCFGSTSRGVFFASICPLSCNFPRTISRYARVSTRVCPNHRAHLFSSAEQTRHGFFHHSLSAYPQRGHRCAYAGGLTSNQFLHPHTGPEVRVRYHVLPSCLSNNGGGGGDLQLAPVAGVCSDFGTVMAERTAYLPAHVSSRLEFFSLNILLLLRTLLLNTSTMLPSPEDNIGGACVLRGSFGYVFNLMLYLDSLPFSYFLAERNTKILLTSPLNARPWRSNQDRAGLPTTPVAAAATTTMWAAFSSSRKLHVGR